MLRFTRRLSTDAPPPDRAGPLRLRLLAWILVSAALLLGTPAWLWLLRGTRLLDHHATLFAGWAILGGAIVAMLALLKTTPPDAVVLPPRVNRAIIIGGAAWLQLLAVLLLMPVLSEDGLRYRLDGKLWLLGVSPYAHAPAELEALGNRSTPADESFRPDAIDRLVVRPDLPTIYLPTSELAFVGIRSIEYVLLPDLPAIDVRPGETWRDVAPRVPFAQRLLLLRVAAALGAVGATALLVSALRRRRQSAWWAAIFGWSPLVVIECGGMGHQDILGVVLLLTAAQSWGRTRFGRAGLFLTAAALVKPLAILPLPWAVRESVFRRRRLRRVVIGVAVPVLVALPILLYQRGYAGLWRTTSEYLNSWVANGLIFDGLNALLGGPGARAAGAVLVAVLGVWLWRRRVDPATAGHALFLALLLVSPVVYPWYLMWPLGLVPLLKRGGAAVAVWCATAGLTYELWPALGRTGLWQLPPGWLAAEYAPVLAVLAWEVWRSRASSPPTDTQAGSTQAGT